MPLGRWRSNRSPALVVLGIVLAALWPPAPIDARPAPPMPAASPEAEQRTTLDTPDKLVTAGVTSYWLTDPKLFWHSEAFCPPPPPSIIAQNAEPQAAADPERVLRIPYYGGTIRTLFSQNDPRPSGVCNPYDVRSNIVADQSFVYWVDNSGLVQLPVEANVGDPPILMSAAVSNTGASQYSTPIALTIDADNVYALTHSASQTFLRRVVKATGSQTQLYGFSGSGEALATDGEYIYWLRAGELHRYDPATNNDLTIDSGVSAFFAEGIRSVCLISPPSCFFSKYVFYGKGKQIFRYNNLTGGAATLLYTSANPQPAAIRGLRADGVRLFFFEAQDLPCSPDPCFPSVNWHVMRRGRGPSGATDILYVVNAGLIGSEQFRNLSEIGDYIFWQEQGSINRLAKDAAALPMTNLRVTAIEVTQGIQNLSNGVPLIKGRRTFVRVHVKSDGPSVSGVTAKLTNPDAPLLTLWPVNSSGKLLTVPSSPDRATINHSFLFELPWSWVSGSSLRLQAEVNPNRIPPQASYANNVMSVGPLTLKNSPRLKVQFVAWGYQLNNQIYYPNIINDVSLTYSWLLRAYPLASTLTFANDTSTPGLNVNTWYVFDESLGTRVDRSAAACDEVEKDANGKWVANSSLCAAALTNALMPGMRSENGISPSIFFYGMISDAAGIFPRGFATDGKVSSGPVGTPVGSWDKDKTYGDWYAGHEIGHTLGRGHPSANGDDPATKNTVEGCGHSRDDPSYPYPDAKIGPNDGSLMGFDPGDAGFQIKPAVLPGTIWTDVMSYCSSEWLSDYTYNGMYEYMIANPSSIVAQRFEPKVEGDLLSVGGLIYSSGAAFTRVSRIPSATSIPARPPGPYSIRLLAADGTNLATYSFTGYALHEMPVPTTTFDQIVPFVAGTRIVQIARNADNVVLGSRTISANPPSVGAVALQPAPSGPVSGVATLGWTASDADGDPLRFDVLYSRDGGVSFQPVVAGVAGASVSFDTARLGGGTAIFRVVASDGAQTARADSAPFTMANKPPIPYILAPGHGNQFFWEQLVNFSGVAEDPQDGGVPNSGLAWRNQKGPLGTGPQISRTDLPVGTNVITLTATNGAGLSASTAITIVVKDDLSLPGPTLSVAPTSVAWHVPTGSTAVQTATLGVSNIGAGALNWTGADDASWLTLAPTTGAAPSSVVISANPSGLPNGFFASATITISGAAQVVTVPVTIAVGDVWSTNGAGPYVTTPVPDPPPGPGPGPGPSPGATQRTYLPGAFVNSSRRARRPGS
ncbi:MAG: hypothetical protein U0556_05765 [Dehalococcoidia bacterium]